MFSPPGPICPARRGYPQGKGGQEEEGRGCQEDGRSHHLTYDPSLNVTDCHFTFVQATKGPQAKTTAPKVSKQQAKGAKTGTR